MQPESNPYWSMTEGAFNCLIDKTRTNTLAAALKQIVRPGDIVVDAGTGTGILAMVAAAAGAKKVFAIEQDQRSIDRLKRTFRLNGMQNIDLMHGDACNLELPGKIDIFVVEMIATGLIEELQVVASNNLLRFAKGDSRFLINEYNAYVDLVWNNNFYYGFEFDIFRYEYPEDADLKSIRLSEKQKLFSIDFSQKNLCYSIKKVLSIRIISGGKINGIRISGMTRLGDGTSLGATSAYDYPLILPVDEMYVNTDQKIRIEIQYVLNGGFSTLLYSLKFE